MHSRALLYVLIFAVWVIFTAGVIVYQDRDGNSAGEHPETDAEVASQRGRQDFGTAA